MRGFPLLNFLLVSAGLLLLLIPLVRVDRPTVPPPVTARGTPAAGPGVPVTLLLRLVHPAEELQVSIAGQAVALRGSGLEREGTALLSLTDRALELELKAVWPDGTMGTMVEVRAAPDGMEEQVQNIWAAEGAADEILRFSWRATP